MIRISVGNLAPRVRCGDKEYTVVTLNSGAFKRGRRLWQPLGGAAELTEKARAFLTERYGAHEFKGLDARFLVDDEHLEAIFDLLGGRNPELIEGGVERELQEELCEEELEGIPPVLTPEEAATVVVHYVGTVRQPFLNEGGTSPLEVKDAPSRRFFNLFRLEVSEEVLAKMRASAAIRILTPEEVASTNYGLTKGRTADGETIADNLMWVE